MITNKFPVMPFHLRDFDRGQREDLIQVWLYLSIETLLFCQTDVLLFCQIDLPNFKLKFVLPNFGQTLRTSFLANFYLMPPQLCMGPDITRPESDPFSYGYPWKIVPLACLLNFLWEGNGHIGMAWPDSLDVVIRKEGIGPEACLSISYYSPPARPNNERFSF